MRVKAVRRQTPQRMRVKAVRRQTPQRVGVKGNKETDPSEDEGKGSKETDHLGFVATVRTWALMETVRHQRAGKDK